MGKARTPDNAPTDYIRIGEQEPPPVFVDPTGGRRRWMRRTAYAVGVLLVLALIVVWLSQLGGSARPPERTPRPSSAAAISGASASGGAEGGAAVKDASGGGAAGSGVVRTGVSVRVFVR
ncbi:hypothetical protein Ade02nite_51150 [Paractinoplanes deccanensis]|uniref:Uncharacterized protein n=1 Tax=Paractinoplanes deccanensis TaxID=113561 RepID=A0ABQ3Y8Z6_9ACTN|nr:hypothetical protein Ade02nite_51150 [Actinoplanes deccanensis]